VVDGDCFTEVQRFLEQTYGAPDSTIHSSALVANARSLTYTPPQIGVVLNLTGNWKETILSIIGLRKG
jgi:hypothetical protein